MHCDTNWGYWAVDLLQCTTTLPRESGLWNGCNALPHYLGSVGSGTTAKQRHTAWGLWAVEVLQCTATLHRGGGSGTPQIHWHIASG